MIPLLVFLYVRRYIRKHPELVKNLVSGSKIILLLLLMIFITRASLAQNRVLIYEVLRNGKPAGMLQVQCSSFNENQLYKLESKVKVKMLMTFTAESFEEIKYENGVLVYSSLFRKLNGSEKNNKRMFITTAGYEVQTGDKRQSLSLNRIHESTLTLYHKEPVGLQRIYSDNFQQYLELKKITDHRYHLIFPDGSWSEYSYSNGVCTAVYVNNPLFTLVMQLKQ